MKILAGLCVLLGAIVLVTAYTHVDLMDQVVGVAGGILYMLAGLAVMANLEPRSGRVLGWLMAAAVMITLGRVLVGLLASVYRAPELLGGLIAVGVPGGWLSTSSAAARPWLGRTDAPPAPRAGRRARGELAGRAGIPGVCDTCRRQVVDNPHRRSGAYCA